MAERWPASMRATTAAEYLDVSETVFRRIADRGEVPAIQFDERGERRYLKEDLDAFLERRRNAPVLSQKA